MVEPNQSIVSQSLLKLIGILSNCEVSAFSAGFKYTHSTPQTGWVLQDYISASLLKCSCDARAMAVVVLVVVMVVAALLSFEYN